MATTETCMLAFERELECVLKSSSRHLSNRLFGLLNKFQSKLDKVCYQIQLLKIGDKLNYMKDYSLANTHGYGRYLKSVKSDGSISDVINETSSSEEQLLLTLRAVVGHSLCQYRNALLLDEDFRMQSTCELALLILHDMRLCLQVGLKYECLYWLIHNAVNLIYSVARKLLKVNLHGQVIYSLICSCLTMESSISLMTVRYLPLRINLYTAVCACYYALQEPLQAELFARRGLDKIHQLAQIEYITSKSNVSSSDIFTEASLKLGIMIFKRSVLESHKKTKSILRPKVRPLIKDLLQSNWPRSPTEKLLDEMFHGHAAHFLAIMEALSVNLSRPLNRKAPKPITKLDEDTVTDVYQELLTAGVELALCGFEQQEKNQSLLNLAIQGSDIIPLSAIIQFIHICYQADCLEGFMMLADTAIELMGLDAISVKIVLAVDELRDISKQGTEEKRIWDKAMLLLDVLYTASSSQRVYEDLLFDSSLLLWEKISDVFKGLISNDSASSKSFLGSHKFLEVLRKMLFLFHCVYMSVCDPLLYGELVLKYTLLLETQADLSLSGLSKGDQELLTRSSVYYDQKQLLFCLQVIEEALQDMSKARCFSTDTIVLQLHTEIYNSYWRIKVKLSTTKPPKYPVENTKKPCSLPLKVMERQENVLTWNKILSLTTSSDIPIQSEKELREECGSNQYHLALLLINLAIFSCHDKKERSAYLKEAAALLSTPDKYSELRNETIPPAPIAMTISPCSITFAPNPSFSHPVSYYALYGRTVAKSNNKVRLNDCHMPGLGVEVPVGKNCVLKVTGLQPNLKYIFAVAAYDSKGQLLGDSIGHSTKPILTSFILSDSIIWGLMCQSAFLSDDLVLARDSATVLWNSFVQPLDDKNKLYHYRLKTSVSNSSFPLTHLFINSVLVHVQADIEEKMLYPDSSRHCLLSSIDNRLSLIQKLLVALEVAGGINNHAFCLQLVIMCYTLLVPLIQACAITGFISEVLIQCHAVLEELPENVLNGKSITFGIHHMVSAISFCLVKHLSNLNEKSLLMALIESSRNLLSVTLPSNIVSRQSSSSGNASLQNPSLVSSASIAVTSTLSFASQSSFLPTSHDKASNKKHQKKKKKKALALNDDVPDELKSTQHKLLGAYFLSQIGIKNMDDLDLTGQEDPVFLHVALKALPVHAAYKEVTKFKRRPQYLEFFVHLCVIVMTEGKGEQLLSWSNDVFTWLTKRNEILLSVKSPQVHKSELSKDTPMAPKLHTCTQANSHSGLAKHRLSSRTERSSSSQKSIPLIVTSQSKSVKKPEASLIVLKQRITRDDLGMKATVILQTLLPSLWRTFHCRHKLRAACNEEHSWRAQVNILLASCVLEKISSLLKIDFSQCMNQSDNQRNSFVNNLDPYYPVMPKDQVASSLNDPCTLEEEQIERLLLQMVLHYQRAAVLSYRGFCWVLLVNACRGLWNGLIILQKYIKNKKASILSLSKLFGLSLKTLYIASSHLLDMYRYFDFNKAKQTSTAIMLTDKDFLSKFVVMTIEVCFVNRHWEKTLFLCEGLTTIVSNGNLASIILKAREQLEQRIQKYSKICRHKPIDPAAHLDTIGYDLYNKVGHSLGMTNVQLQNFPGQNGVENGEELLLQADKLADAYINKHIVNGAVLSAERIGYIADIYNKAVDLLLMEGKIALAIDGSHSMGNLMHHCEKLKSACYWWEKGLKVMFQCMNPLKDWQNLVAKSAKLTKHEFIIGGVVATKLARYIYKDLDAKLNCFLLAAYLFKCFVQVSTLLHPVRDIEYVDFKISLDNFLAPEVFRNYNLSVILSSLQCTVKELTECGYSLEVLPLVCFYEFIALTYTRNVQHTILARVYKLKALTQLASYGDALKILKDLINGARLPELTSEFNINVNNRGAGYEFDDGKFLNYPQNYKLLSFITDKQSLTALKGVHTCSTQFLYEELILSMANLLVSLASTCTIIPSSVQLSTTTTNAKCENIGVGDVKVVLLRAAERQLQELLIGSTNYNAYYLLGQIAFSLGYAANTAQICVAALRDIQKSKDIVGMMVWLRLCLLLIKSFFQMTLPNEVLKSVSKIMFGIKEGCELFCHTEICSEFLYILACQEYKTQPPSLDQVVELSQNCIGKLNSCEFLSSFGKKLKANATLLLTEVLALKKTPVDVIVTSYRGIIKMLEQQLQEGAKTKLIACVTDINCYRSQLPLIVQAYLWMLMIEIQQREVQADTLTEWLDNAITIAETMANSNPVFLSVLLQQYAFLDRKDGEKLSKELNVKKAISFVLPFDYMLLQDLLILLSHEMNSGDDTQNLLLLEPPEPTEKTLTKTKDMYLYKKWCAVKCAGSIYGNFEQLQHLSSQLDNETMNNSFSNIETPGVAVMDLCYSKKLINALLTHTLNSHLTLDLLLPFSQNFSSTELNWFDIVSYFWLVIKQCFSHSSNHHTNHLTPNIIPKAVAIFEFLQLHCATFNKLCVPEIPSLLFSTDIEESESSCLSGLFTDAYPMASDNEISVFWYNTNKQIQGIFAFNGKAVNGRVQSSNLSMFEFEVYCVTVDSSKLTELRIVWHDLSITCGSYLAQQAVRPLSRSPSRMRQRTLEQSKLVTPSDLLKAIDCAVFLLLDTFKIKNQDPPRVEPHMVAGITRVLKPAVLVTEKGDGYYFFKTLLS